MRRRKAGNFAFPYQKPHALLRDKGTGTLYSVFNDIRKAVGQSQSAQNNQNYRQSPLAQLNQADTDDHSSKKLQALSLSNGLHKPIKPTKDKALVEEHKQ
jgi:hypothetical protein